MVGDKIGRIHLGRQDLGKLQTRKMKGLKRFHDDLDEDARTSDAEDKSNNESEGLSDEEMREEVEESDGMEGSKAGDLDSKAKRQRLQ